MALPTSRNLRTLLAVATRTLSLLRTWRAMGRLLALLMVVSLPIHSVTAAVADLLGPRHAHRADSSAVDRTDPMAGWRDFRRAHHDHLTEASVDAEAAHVLAHANGQRHHHDLFDTTLENVEMTGDDDGAASGAAGASAAFVFIAAAPSASFEAGVAAIGEGWPAQRDARLRSAETRRLERPPQRLG